MSLIGVLRMTDILLKPTETWTPMNFPPMPLRELKKLIAVKCANCDEVIEPIKKGNGLYYACTDCGSCKECGSIMEERFESDSPSCSEKVWVCSQCGATK